MNKQWMKDNEVVNIHTRVVHFRSGESTKIPNITHSKNGEDFIEMFTERGVFHTIYKAHIEHTTIYSKEKS